MKGEGMTGRVGRMDGMGEPLEIDYKWPAISAPLIAAAAARGYECPDCGVTGMDISQEGVDPDFWFERGDDGVMRCGGCEAIQSANRRFEAGDW